MDVKLRTIDEGVADQEELFPALHAPVRLAEAAQHDVLTAGQHLPVGVSVEPGGSSGEAKVGDDRGVQRDDQREEALLVPGGRLLERQMREENDPAVGDGGRRLPAEHLGSRHGEDVGQRGWGVGLVLQRVVAERGSAVGEAVLLPVAHQPEREAERAGLVRGARPDFFGQGLLEQQVEVALPEVLAVLLAQQELEGERGDRRGLADVERKGERGGGMQCGRVVGRGGLARVYRGDVVMGVG